MLQKTSDITAAFFKKFPECENCASSVIEDNGFHIGGYRELEKWLNHTE